MESLFFKAKENIPYTVPALLVLSSRGPLTLTDPLVRGCVPGKPREQDDMMVLLWGNSDRRDVSPSNLIKVNSFIKLLWLPSYF